MFDLFSSCVWFIGQGNFTRVGFDWVDNRDSLDPKITPEQADGVIFAVLGTNGTDYTMRIFNSDGREPGMCGNGVRCFARFIAELAVLVHVPLLLLQFWTVIPTGNARLNFLEDLCCCLGI